jgi:hypothetical protein
MNVVIASKKSITFWTTLWFFNNLLNPACKHFGQDAARGPQIDLLAIVNVSIEEFGTSEVSGRYVGY